MAPPQVTITAAEYVSLCHARDDRKDMQRRHQEQLDAKDAEIETLRTTVREQEDKIEALENRPPLDCIHKMAQRAEHQRAVIERQAEEIDDQEATIAWLAKQLRKSKTGTT